MVLSSLDGGMFLPFGYKLGPLTTKYYKVCSQRKPLIYKAFWALDYKTTNFLYKTFYYKTNSMHACRRGSAHARKKTL